MPTNGVRDSSPPRPDVSDSLVLESVPSRMSADESLKHIAERYLRNPGSQVDMLRMGLSPSGGRLRVMIVLDIDI